MFSLNVFRIVFLAVLVISGGALAQHEDHGHGGQRKDDDATAHHSFDDAESWARHFEDPARDEWQMPDRIVGALVDRDDLVIVDIGSATGYFPVRFAAACPRGKVFGADVEADMVWYLNDRVRKENIPNLVSILAAPDDPHVPEPVDIVFLCNTYHHINDRIDYFTRLKEKLKAGARVAVVDFRPSSHRGPPHKLAPETIQSEMKSAGYTLARQHDFLPDQYFLVFEMR
jgi:cyclopropane fatty-acyl-phospholipid synthase-like methyltransferase